jgi:hypothetical protein
MISAAVQGFLVPLLTVFSAVLAVGVFYAMARK